MAKAVEKAVFPMTWLLYQGLRLYSMASPLSALRVGSALVSTLGAHADRPLRRKKTLDVGTGTSGPAIDQEG
ncbi:uncharacterized protein PGTG_20699 [Puccinia graminis f. sp. tritici CRL 75-36-700-3]|uniref:Uncharacterized protein n=1 Tax=Puccinia graminis f. sp. tritici (strain CRL 75-36-700-3 / race SCCL) TaxID=418459 RepID=H6QPA0_PUCGT|nr:uncharacterized protein PGTG_20699 [Puccinia graminis f. sp. tritici CRL 75-36-700-3]EHS63605.1 hypothetical protein PGTG_20699 [Puccinia graminis f. sp. tritici CRL 75-36-700-3]